MRTVNEQARREKRIDIMEKCFDCYAEHGLTEVGVKTIAEACGCNVASLYQYFENLDDIIVQSTEYCMSGRRFYGESPHRCGRLVAVYRRDTLLDGKKARQEISPDVPGLYTSEIQRIR